MKAAEARELMEELERIEKSITDCQKVLQGRSQEPAERAERKGVAIAFFPQIYVPISDAVAYMHLDCYIFDLETRRNSIKQQLGVE